MTPEDYIKALIGIAITAIGYFLKDLHNRFKGLENKVDKNVSRYHDEVSSTKARVASLENQLNSEMKNLEKVIDIKLSNLENQNKEMQSSIKHLEKTYTENVNVLAELILEIKRKN